MSKKPLLPASAAATASSVLVVISVTSSIEEIVNALNPQK
jgi:hypothetical protein